MSRFTRHIARQLMGYTLGSQANSLNPLVLAKVDDRFGSTSWYLTEYDPQSRIARAYVKNHAMQGWVTLSIDALDEQRWYGLFRYAFLDRQFQPKHLKQLQAQMMATPRKRL